MNRPGTPRRAEHARTRRIPVLSLLLAAAVGGGLYVGLTVPLYRASTELRLGGASASTTGDLSVAASLERLRSRDLLLPAIEQVGADVSRGAGWHHCRVPVGGHHALRAVQLSLPAAWQGRPFELALDGNGFELRDDAGHARVQGAFGQELAFSLDGQPARIRVESERDAQPACVALTQEPAAVAYERVQKHLRVAPVEGQPGLVRVEYDDAEPLRAAALVDRLVSAFVVAEARVNAPQRQAEAEPSPAVERNRQDLQRRRADLERQLADAKTRRAQLDRAGSDPLAQAEASAQIASTRNALMQVYDTQARLEQAERQRAATALAAATVATGAAVVGAEPVWPQRAAGYLALVVALAWAVGATLRTLGWLRAAGAHAAGALVGGGRNAWRRVASVVAGMTGRVSTIGAGPGGALRWPVLMRGTSTPPVVEAVRWTPPADAWVAVPALDVNAPDGSSAATSSAVAAPALEPITLSLIDPVEPPATPAPTVAAEPLKLVIRPFTQHEARPTAQVLMVAAPDYDSGSADVAFRMARTFAARGRRVLLLEADLRHPQLQRRLMMRTPVAGLSDVLVGVRPLDQAITRHEASGADVMLQGMPALSPAELLFAPELSEMMTTLRERFEHIVVHVPPLLLAGDALAFAPLVDSAALVVVPGEQASSAAAEAAQRLERAGIVVERVAGPMVPADTEIVESIAA